MEGSSRILGRRRQRPPAFNRPTEGDGDIGLASALPTGTLDDRSNGLRPSFGARLRSIRQRAACKQAVISRAIGCTDAALSLWETGARLPTRRSMSRILVAFATYGASTEDLLALRGLWRSECTRRSMHRARPPAAPVDHHPELPASRVHVNTPRD
jgi:DNA-binding transcriptional regulator YiaG